MSPANGENQDIDFEFFESHFTPWDDRFPQQVLAAAPRLLKECPVTRSDALGGFWIAHTHSALVEVLQNWRCFSSVKEKSLTPLRPTTPTQPPISVDPPLQTAYRQLLNPFLTPKKVAAFEPAVRRQVIELIEGFGSDRRCDFFAEFALEFPGRMLYSNLFDVSPEEVPKVQRWTKKCTQEPTAPDTPDYEREWAEWTYGLIAERRSSPRRDDIIDALLHGEVQGRRLTDEEVMGAMMILVLGGFNTTTDSLSSIMFRLAERPALQQRLRDDPTLIPAAVEECLRFDPPVSMQPRLCVAETAVSGEQVSVGDRIAVNFVTANRDPNEFQDPDTLDVDRAKNRHVSFGIGVHRCIGSNVARMNLRVSLEELLSRLGPFRLTISSSEVPRSTGYPWGPTYLPLEFGPT